MKMGMNEKESKRIQKAIDLLMNEHEGLNISYHVEQDYFDEESPFSHWVYAQYCEWRILTEDGEQTIHESTVSEVLQQISTCKIVKK